MTSIQSTIATLFLMLALTEITTYAHPSTRSLSVNQKQVQMIANYIDWSADPCEDFFAYACGNWTEFHNTLRYTEATGLIDHKINKKFALLFENYRLEHNRHSQEQDRHFEETFKQVWTYYRSCKREKLLKLHKYLQLVRPAERLNWPVLHQLEHGNKTWPKEHFNWWLTLGKLRRYGLKGTIIEHLILAKLDDRDKYVIDIDRASAISKLPKRSLAINMLKLLELTTKQAVVIYDDILRFERQIEALLEIEDEYGLLEVSIQELEDDLPQLKWRKYIEHIVQHQIDDDFSLQIRNWAYFLQLVTLMDETQPEIVCNYIMLKFLQHLIDDGTASFEKIDCIVDVRSKMDVATNHIYREHYYKHEAAIYEREVQELLAKLQQEFQQLLLANRLQFQQQEIDFFIKKLQNIRLNFGNLPAESEEQSIYIADYYRGLELNSRNYYKNHLALLELRFRKEHEQLDHPRSAENYFFITDSDTARSSTPYYLVRQNVIVVPYGILQPPMYHKNMHALLKFSLLGFLLAHELVHGFDASGMAYNYLGNMEDLGVNTTDNEPFAESVRCLQREETDSIDERIADVQGIRLAYNAYFGDARVGGVDPQSFLQFSEFSQRRLFFLNMAEFFCGSMDAIFMDHDSDNVRLQQTLLHFEQFAEEFNCELGDAMHPEEQCRLW